MVSCIGPSNKKAVPMRKSALTLLVLALSSFAATAQSVPAGAVESLDSEVVDRASFEPLSQEDIQKMEVSKVLGLTKPAPKVVALATPSKTR